jgi:hypothetical protein
MDTSAFPLAPVEMYVADGGYHDGGMYGDTPTGLNNADQGESREI